MILMQHLPIPTPSTPSSSTLNLQAITIWTSKTKFIIEPNYQKSGIPTCLHIERKQGKVYESQQINNVDDYQPHFFSAFLGLLDFNGKKVIVLVEKVALTMSIGERDVFKIVKPVYLFINSQDKKKLTEQQSMILINLTSILQQGMYFSYSYNLSQPLNTINPPEESSSQQPEEKLNFNWSTQLHSSILHLNPMWRLAIIQGYVDKIEMIINGLKIFIFLISRRCISRSGTLYSMSGRGVDKNGFVANFVQTQLILNVNAYFFSYLQLRGSVPLYWYEEQSYGGMNKAVKFLHSIEENDAAFVKHLKLIKSRNDFENVGIVNLLNENNTFEKGLIQNYEYLVMKNFDKQTFSQQQLKTHHRSQKDQYSSQQIGQSPKRVSLPYLKHSDLSLPSQVSYAYFDIHSQCQKKYYKPLLQFIQINLQPLLHQFEFTVLKLDQKSKKKQVLNTQKGIFRINCMNCIDRSNIAQLSIGAYMIAFMLKHLGIFVPEFQKGISFVLNDDAFTNLYREMWADNADALSKQYTGTGSTQSFAVRKGKLSYLTTIDHGMKSLTRAIKNIRNPDQIKNKSIKLLTGYHQPKVNDSDTCIIELKQRKEFNRSEMKQLKTQLNQNKSAAQLITTKQKRSYETQKQQKIEQIKKIYQETQNKIKDLESLEQSSLQHARQFSIENMNQKQKKPIIN